MNSKNNKISFEYDIKSIFLNIILKKELNIKFLPDFEEYENNKKNYRLKWALYGLQQSLYAMEGLTSTYKRLD